MALKKKFSAGRQFLNFFFSQVVEKNETREDQTFFLVFEMEKKPSFEKKLTFSLWMSFKRFSEVDEKRS